MATYLALGVIAVVYAGAAWAMAAHAGQSHVVAAAGQEGPGLLFGLGDGFLSNAAQLLFLTSLFAAALAFHNVVWRYMYALGREHVLPAVLGRTGGNNIPKAASLVQSATGLAVIVAFAAGGWPPMTDLFFWLGTTGGFGILLLLALTSIAVVAFFFRDGQGESLWSRLHRPGPGGGTAYADRRPGRTELRDAARRPRRECRLLDSPGQLRPRVRGRRCLGRAAQDPATTIVRRNRARRVCRDRSACAYRRRDRPVSGPDAPADVISADEADAAVLSQVIADAFLDLPPSWWLIADQAVRRRVFPEYFRIFVEAALADGIVHTTQDRTAVAIWLPSGTAAPSPADPTRPPMSQLTT